MWVNVDTRGQSDLILWYISIYIKVIWVQLKNKKGASTLMGLYCKSPKWEIEEQTCRQITDRCQRVILLGKFNFLSTTKRLDGQTLLSVSKEISCNGTWVVKPKKGTYWTLWWEVGLAK